MYNFTICNETEIRDRRTGAHLGTIWLEESYEGRWSAVVAGTLLQASSPMILRLEIHRHIKYLRSACRVGGSAQAASSVVPFRRPSRTLPAGSQPPVFRNALLAK
ncbi:hypothetical protein HKCCE2091_07905 [Rhodobacterales bacterium HKCCE2091]|nr:hypothetical protein [Rhodobacterales bacterium HKCCE2091]